MTNGRSFKKQRSRVCLEMTKVNPLSAPKEITEILAPRRQTQVGVGQGFWVYGISGFLISGIQYFYVENGVLSITLF